MNDTVTVESIKRQLAALDEQFASDENGRSGKMKQDEWARRRAALLARLRKAEQEDRDAPHVAQVPRAAPSAQQYVMPTTSVKQLRKFNLDFEAALDAGDVDAALAILQNEDFVKLTYLDELEDAGELGAAAYAAASGARATLATRYISLAGMRRRALEARVAALESAIPQYRGVYRSGQSYPKHSMVTDHSNLWISLKETDTRPPGESWQLCARGAR